jgi:hypothetical protein
MNVVKRLNLENEKRLGLALALPAVIAVLVVLVTGQLVSRRSGPGQASGPTPSAGSTNSGIPTG